jgi:heavy metal efflux system protein
MTGARQDVVVKVYGEDLDQLTAYATTIGKLISAIDGTESLFIENMTGLSQIVIRIKRDQLARYNLTVRQVNEVINISMAGQSAGVLFEGEKRFDMNATELPLKTFKTSTSLHQAVCRFRYRRLPMLS